MRNLGPELGSAARNIGWPAEETSRCSARSNARLFLYSVKFLCSMQANETYCEPPVRPGKYATTIGIYNPGSTNPPIRKYLLRSYSPEPLWAVSPESASRIMELLLGGGSGGNLPLTSGILEIVSTRKLSVSATYMVTSGSGKIDIDVARDPRPGGHERG